MPRFNTCGHPIGLSSMCGGRRRINVICIIWNQKKSKHVNCRRLIHDCSRSKRHRVKAKRILVRNMVQFFVVCPQQVIDTQLGHRQQPVTHKYFLHVESTCLYVAGVNVYAEARILIASYVKVVDNDGT